MRPVVILAAYVVGEGLVAQWLAGLLGWPAVLGLFAIGLVVGILVMHEAGTQAGRCLRTAAGQAAPTMSSADTDIGSSGLLFAGGVLLAIPGVLTDVAGLILVVPTTRRWCRRPATALLMTVIRRMSLNVAVGGGFQARVPPTANPRHSDGQVIIGEVVDRREEPPRS